MRRDSCRSRARQEAGSVPLLTGAALMGSKALFQEASLGAPNLASNGPGHWRDLPAPLFKGGHLFSVKLARGGSGQKEGPIPKVFRSAPTRETN